MGSLISQQSRDEILTLFQSAKPALRRMSRYTSHLLPKVTPLANLKTDYVSGIFALIGVQWRKKIRAAL